MTLLLVNAAFASNLCNLTTPQVADVLDYYDSELTIGQMTPFIDSPMDCANFGDMCGDFGQNTTTVVCELWSDMINHDSLASIGAHLDALQAQYQNDGPAAHDADCSYPRKSFIDDGSNRLRGKSYAYTTGVYSAIGGSSKAWYKSGGQWVFDNTELVSVDGTYDAYVTAVEHCTIENREKDESDGFVADRMSGVWAVRSDFVTNAHATPWLGTMTCRNGLIWSSPCPPPLGLSSIGLMLGIASCSRGVPIDTEPASAVDAIVIVRDQDWPTVEGNVGGGLSISHAFDERGAYVGGWAYAAFAPTGPRTFIAEQREACYTREPDGWVPGLLDRGPSVDLDIGGTTRALRRDTDFEAGQTVYTRDYGATANIAPGATTRFMATDTKTLVPQGFGQMPGPDFETFASSGLLKVTWGGSPADFIALSVSTLGPEIGAVRKNILCRFDDDGEATLQTAAPGAIKVASLHLSRWDTARVDVPDVGIVDVSNVTSSSTSYQAP